MALVRFAGFDERENEFPPNGTRFDLSRLSAMRAKGMSWKDIGIALAAEEGRPLPYQPTSLAGAVSRAKQANRSAALGE